MTGEVCGLTHSRDPDRLRRAEGGGSKVCAGHRSMVDEALAELPAFWWELSRAHLPRPTGIGRGSRSAERPIPYRDAVGDERELIRCQLSAMSDEVAERRKCTPPAHPEPFFTAPFLRVHLGWLLASDIALEAAEAVVERRTRAFGLLYPTGRRRFLIVGPGGLPARCAEVDDDGERCSGSLYAVLRDVDALLPSALTCDVCGFDLPAHAWLRFGRRLWRDEAEAAAREREIAAPQAIPDDLTGISGLAHLRRLVGLD